MVSTRGVRYKFSEGERVLCYEPDPTKAKVLYDSKVLEVIESKDKRGRRTVEYLIHFQGWNSSWDRCVSEDFVLKDTEENRQLQRDLAERSQLQLGAYLYRRERKKGTHGSGPNPAKRARQGFSDDGSSSSTQPDEVETAGDTDSSLGSSASQVSPPPGPATINLPPALRDRLTFDYHLVVKRGRLSALPASPSAAEILESFVKWFARSGAWRPVRPPRPDPPVKPDLLDVSCRLNLVREVADGLRVYFDFILKGHLLYKQELDQYHEICGKYMDAQELQIKQELEEINLAKESLVGGCPQTEMRSPRLPEYSHLPPDPAPPPPPPPSDDKSDSVTSESPTERGPCLDALDKEHAKSGDDSRTDEAAPRAPAPQPRRLRSHKSAVSVSDAEQTASSSAPPDHRTIETRSSSVGSSSSSVSGAGGGGGASGGGGGRAASVPPPHAPTRTPLSALLDKVAKWQIIPREGTEHLPCRIYGATHLARLFVKLPEFLNATHMTDMKLKLILKHIDMFVQFLDEHNEWFGEMYYVADNIDSRSH